MGNWWDKEVKEVKKGIAEDQNKTPEQLEAEAKEVFWLADRVDSESSVGITLNYPKK